MVAVDIADALADIEENIYSRISEPLFSTGEEEPDAARACPAGLRLGRDDRHRRVLVLATRQYRDVLIFMNDQDRRRRRALIVFQLVIYTALLSMFAIQLHMLLVRDW